MSSDENSFLLGGFSLYTPLEEELPLHHTLEELESVQFADGINFREQSIIDEYDLGRYGPLSPPAHWPSQFRQSVLVRSKPAAPVQNTETNRNARLIGQCQDKLNKIFELATQLEGTSLYGRRHEFPPLLVNGSVDEATKKRLQSFKNFFARNVSIQTDWGTGFTKEIMGSIRRVHADLEARASMIETEGASFESSFTGKTGGMAMEGSHQLRGEVISSAEEISVDGDEVPLGGFEEISPSEILPVESRRRFGSEALLSTARQNGNVELLYRNNPDGTKITKPRCSAYTREFLSEISTIPYYKDVDAWNVRQKIAPSVEDQSQISMRRFYSGLPSNVIQGKDYQTALQQFYQEAMNRSPAVMTLYNENTGSRKAKSRTAQSDPVSHIGVSLGGLVSTERIQGGKTLADALKEHYGIKPGLEFLLGNIEVAYQDKQVFYNSRLGEFVSFEGEIVQLPDGMVEVSVKDIRLAHQLGEKQGFASLIALMASGQYHPADLLPIKDDFLKPEYKDFEVFTKTSASKKESLDSAAERTPVTSTFYVKPGENLSEILRQKKITGERYALFQLYCADKLNLLINHPFTETQQFAIPDFSAYKRELESRGGMTAVASQIASLHYPDKVYVKFVVGRGDDAYDLLDRWFGKDFVFGLSDNAKDKLIRSVFDENNYYVGAWPNRDAADWAPGMIFGLKKDRIEIYRSAAAAETRKQTDTARSQSTKPVTIVIKGESKKMDPKLVYAAMSATENPREQADLLALYVIEKGQGGNKAWVEDIVEHKLGAPLGFPKTRGAIETNVVLYARERGITEIEARQELDTDPAAAMRFALGLLNGYRRDVNRVADAFEKSHPGVTVGSEQRSLAALDAFNAGSIKRSSFMGYQYMIYLMSQKLGVATEDSAWDMGIDLMGDRSDFVVDGYAGRSAAIQIRLLLDKMDPTGKTEKLFDGEIKSIEEGKELTSGPLYEYICNAYQHTMGARPVLFLWDQALRQPFVQNNYGLNTQAYAKQIYKELKTGPAVV